MPANNRFSDSLFRDPNLTPEQVARIEKRNEALRIYRETGDTGPAIEAGLFPSKETGTGPFGDTICLTDPTEAQEADKQGEILRNQPKKAVVEAVRGL